MSGTENIDIEYEKCKCGEYYGDCGCVRDEYNYNSDIEEKNKEENYENHNEKDNRDNEENNENNENNIKK